MNRYLFKKNERGYSVAAFRIMRLIIPPTVRFLANPRMSNRHNMPLTGPCFIYANHSNYFDPFLINQEMSREPTAGVMTRYQFFHTLPRIFMGGIGIVPTSKYIPEPGIIREVLRMVEQNRMILIFPEGGRRWDGRPKQVIESTLKLFWRAGIPVHAVQLHGSYLAWPRWADYPRRCNMEVRWMDPLHPGDFSNYDRFAKKCLDLIDFDENHPPPDTLPKSTRKPASGIQRILYRCPVTGNPEAIFTPDGYTVKSRATADFTMYMDKNSRLWDTDNREHSVADIYNRINTMPMPVSNNPVIIPDTPCVLYQMDHRYSLRKTGRASIRLETGRIVINRGSDAINLPIDNIRYHSIESNCMLMLTTPETTFMTDLGKSSALQWQIYVRRLQKGESPKI